MGREKIGKTGGEKTRNEETKGKTRRLKEKRVGKTENMAGEGKKDKREEERMKMREEKNVRKDEKTEQRRQTRGEEGHRGRGRNIRLKNRRDDKMRGETFHIFDVSLTPGRSCQ